VKRWHKQFESIDARRQPPRAVRGCRPVGEAARLDTGRHGAWRLSTDQRAVQPGLRSINAVVDWEMATLGDPLTDVGLLYVYHQLASKNEGVMQNFPPAQGFSVA